MKSSGSLSRRLLGAGALALLLSACASPPHPAVETADYWQGRLALRVDSDPPQALSASFELRGNARQGELLLSGPLGQTAAVADWTPLGARLRQGSQERRYADMQALSAELTGAALPLAALFDWLQGRPVRADGWEVDLSEHAQGRLLARRLAPAPAAELRLRLVQP